VQTLVLDEADRMLDLGFADDLDILFQALPKNGRPCSSRPPSPTKSAAWPRPACAIRCPSKVSPRNTAAKTVTQWVVPCDKKRKTDLFLFMRKDRGWGQVLVFVKTKKGCDELVGRLQAKRIAVDTIHGDRPQASRLKALEAFKAGEIEILVATDVAARGLDIDDLPQVVNYDLPLVAEDYIHRIGRTGRAGASGEAISLVCADEAPLLGAIETLLKTSLSRDEEPGFEPTHRVPPTGPLEAAPPKPKRPRSLAAVRQKRTGQLGWLMMIPAPSAAVSLPAPLAAHARACPAWQVMTSSAPECADNGVITMALSNLQPIHNNAQAT
jgi:superfamily II DNA/RNA helicase